MRPHRVQLLAVLLASFASIAGAYAAEQKVYLAHPVAVDGNTLRDDSGNVYSLFAVKAPKPGRHCLDIDGIDYDCGEKSRSTLEAYSASVLTCSPVNSQQEPHTMRCLDFAGRDIAARMVKSGWALPDRTVSQRYIFEEMEAEARRNGLWQGRFSSAL